MNTCINAFCPCLMLLHCSVRHKASFPRKKRADALDLAMISARVSASGSPKGQEQHRIARPLPSRSTSSWSTASRCSLMRRRLSALVLPKLFVSSLSLSSSSETLVFSSSHRRRLGRVPSAQTFPVTMHQKSLLWLDCNMPLLSAVFLSIISSFSFPSPLLQRPV
jgi:hypothetical protein